MKLTDGWLMEAAGAALEQDWVSIEKEIEFDAGHRVPRHNGKCRNPHGHRYRVVVQCRGPIINDPERSDNGMLIDFGELKTIMMKRIHDVLDHQFIVWENDDALGTALMMIPSMDIGKGIVSFPYVPTAENIARWCWDQILPDIEGEFRDHLELVGVTVWETPTSRATYNG